MVRAEEAVVGQACSETWKGSRGYMVAGGEDAKAETIVNSHLVEVAYC